MAILVFFYSYRAIFLAPSPGVSGGAPTFDLYALYVDAAFGTQPSIWVHNLVAYSQQGKRFTLLKQLRGLSQAGQVGDWPVTLHGPTSSFGGRVCAVRKSEHAIEQAHRRVHRRASKKQMRTKPVTLEVAKYVAVFTTRSDASAMEILEWYRTR